MLLFIAGMLAGAGIAVMILGVLAVAAEDQELAEKARQKHDKRAVQVVEDWYRDCH